MIHEFQLLDDLSSLCVFGRELYYIIAGGEQQLFRKSPTQVNKYLSALKRQFFRIDCDPANHDERRCRCHIVLRFRKLDQRARDDGAGLVVRIKYDDCHDEYPRADRKNFFKRDAHALYIHEESALVDTLNCTRRCSTESWSFHVNKRSRPCDKLTEQCSSGMVFEEIKRREACLVFR